MSILRQLIAPTGDTNKSSTAFPFRDRMMAANLGHELWVAELTQEPEALVLPDDFYQDHFALRQAGKFIGVRSPVRPGSHEYRLFRTTSQDLHDVLFACNDLGMVCDAVQVGSQQLPIRIGFTSDCFEAELHFTVSGDGPFARYKFRPAHHSDLVHYDGHRVTVRSVNGAPCNIGHYP